MEKDVGISASISLPVLESCLTYCELFTMTLCLPIGSEGIDAPPFRLIICYILLQCQRAKSRVNRMKQYEVF